MLVFSLFVMLFHSFKLAEIDCIVNRTRCFIPFDENRVIKHLQVIYFIEVRDI